MASTNRSRPEANMFSASVNPSFLHSEFKAAGNDIFSPTFNVNFTAPLPTHDDIAPEEDVPRRRPPAPTSRSPRSPALKGVKRLLGLLSPRRQQTEKSARLLKYDRQSSYDSDDTPPLTPGSSCAPSPFSSQEDITVSSAEDLDPRLLESQNLTTPQVYVRSMLRSGKGLACWKPRPRKPSSGPRGTVPGDVGTFSAEGGFKKTFNIWDDEELLRRATSPSGGPSFRLSPRSITIEPEEIPQGSTIADGASSQTILSELYTSTISSFEFRCHSHHGAVLAATSSAELEELENHNELREAIIRHPELIYKHANAIRRMGDDEPLYIITGCIKSDSWAVAAFREGMPAPHDAMSLQNMTRAGDTRSKYVWTKRSTSEAYFGSSEEGVKDQTLFLRGFKLDFSQGFRTKMKRQPHTSTHGPSGSGPFGPSDTSKPSGDHEEPGGGRGARFGGRDGGHSGPGGPGSFSFGSNSNTNSAGYQARGSAPYPSKRPRPTHSQPVDSDVSIQSFPRSLQDVCHPSDAINKHLLDITGADFALCHDDEWRFSLDGLDSPNDFINANVDNLEIDVCDGVAVLLQAPSDRRGGSMRRQPPLTSSTNVSPPHAPRIESSTATTAQDQGETHRVPASPPAGSLPTSMVGPTQKRRQRKKKRGGLSPSDTTHGPQLNQLTSVTNGRPDSLNALPVPSPQTRKEENKVPHEFNSLQVLGERQIWPVGSQDLHTVLTNTGLCGSDLHYYTHGRNGDFLVRPPVLGQPTSGSRNEGSSFEGGAKHEHLVEELPSLSTPISTAQLNPTVLSSPLVPSAEVSKPNQRRSRVTVVCTECKRLKMKCDRKAPCGSCTRREQADKCTYTDEALNRMVDTYSVNNRVRAISQALSSLSSGAQADTGPDLKTATSALHIRGDGRTEPPRPADFTTPRLSLPLARSDESNIGTGASTGVYRTTWIPEDQTPTGTKEDRTKPRAINAASRRSPKGAVRTKFGCYTCRIRRKKGDRETSDPDTCRICHRLRLEVLGFGAKRPEWLRDNRNVTLLREQIKGFLASQSLLKSASGPRPRPDGGRPRIDRLSSAFADPSPAHPSDASNSEGSTTPCLASASHLRRVAKPETKGDEKEKLIYGHDPIDDRAGSASAFLQAPQASTVQISKGARGIPGRGLHFDATALDHREDAHMQGASPSSPLRRRQTPLPAPHKPSRPPEGVEPPPSSGLMHLHPILGASIKPVTFHVDLDEANKPVFPPGVCALSSIRGGKLDLSLSGFDGGERPPVLLDLDQLSLDDQGGGFATEFHDVSGIPDTSWNDEAGDTNLDPNVLQQIEVAGGAATGIYPGNPGQADVSSPRVAKATLSRCGAGCPRLPGCS